MGGVVRLCLLGPLEVHRGGDVVRIDGLKGRQALAVLAAARGTAVSEERLTDALWGDHPPETATATLQSHISRLRKALEPLRVATVHGGYALDLEQADVDADRFEALLDRGRRRSRPEEARHDLGQAIGLWRGPAFGDLAELPGVRGEALRLEELRVVATEEWIAARLELGDAATVVGDLEALVDAHPLRERFRTQLMLALHRTGRQGDALRVADRFRHLLRDELGLAPSASVQQLEAQILADDPTLGVAASPGGARDGAAPRSTAPATEGDATSLIGRDEDVARLLDAIGPRRAVTLTGPGGVGKTRVAKQVAALAEGSTQDGVIVVELAPGRDAAAVVDLVARALDLQHGQAATLGDTVVDFLSRKDLVLVLDNCEHVLDAAAMLVDRLRRSCPRVSLLATSRASLGLPGEEVHVLAPLSTPEPDPTASASAIASAPAVRLFVERAVAARPGFELDDTNAPAIGEICRRLDGLPLALELAAARIRALGPEALADRLDERLTLLTGERRGGDERHQTLRRVVEWSHALLDPVQQDVFAQLSVFAGSFTLSAAEAVCRLDERVDAQDPDPGPDSATPSVAAAIADLVDQSMLQVSDPVEPRYLVLETLRELGQVRLEVSGAAGTVEARHRALYLDLAREAALGIDSPDEQVWIQRVDRELDNLRAAHHTAVRAGDVAVATSLVASLREHGFRRIRYEVTSMAEVTMAMAGFTEDPLAPVVAAVAAYGRWVRGDLDAAAQGARAALGLQDALGAPPSGLPERVLGNALFFQGETREAAGWIDRMVEVARRRAVPAGLAHALYMGSVASTSLHDSEVGRARAEEALRWAELAGSPTAAAQAAYANGLVLRSTDTDAADRWLRRAADLGEQAGDRWIRAFALTEVHWLTAQRGDRLAGLTGLAEVIDTWLRGGDWANLWLSLRHVFGLLVELGAHRDAAVLHGKLLSSGATSALPAAPADAERVAAEAERIAAELGWVELDRAVGEGGAMSDVEAVAHTKAVIDRLAVGGAAS